jgi:hypothetical protein
VAERPDRSDRPEQTEDRRRRRLDWGRVSGRTALFVTFIVGVIALASMIVPFNARPETGTGPTGTAASAAADLHCGPPLYEVLSSPDPAFSTPESAGCAAPATRRLLYAGIALALVLALSIFVHRRSRSITADHDMRWLEGQPRSLPWRRDPAPARPSSPSSVPSGRQLPPPSPPAGQLPEPR